MSTEFRYFCKIFLYITLYHESCFMTIPGNPEVLGVFNDLLHRAAVTAQL